MGKDQPEDSEVPFEKALEELERIVREMESDRMPLTDLIDNYERGNKLLRVCQKRIAEAEQRVELIVARESGAQLEEFDVANEKPLPKPAQKKPAATPAPAIDDDEDDEIRLF